MTKREICERLLEIRDQSSAGHLGPVGIGDALRDLILDLAAPEEEKPKSKEAEAVMGTARCPACGLIAYPILGSPFKWRCETHGEFFVYPGETPKRGEGEK
jgi:hypothetical protein